MSKQNVIQCPSSEELFLSFGWLKGENNEHDMLWYNEGNADEFKYWLTALRGKQLTDSPKGRMYFQMLIRPGCDIEIICEGESHDEN